MDWPKVVALVALGALILAGAIVGPRVFARPKADPAIYADLRNRALGFRLEDLGVPLPPDPSTPVGVFMDWDVGGGTATLVAWSSGDTSLYLSSGGGFIGGGQIETANRAAKALVAKAVEYRDAFQPTTAFPLPEPGEVRFYMRTASGARMAAASEDALVTGDHRLSPLFESAQDVITAFRTSQENR